MAHFFEFIQIIYYFTSEECDSVFKCWFVDDHGSAFCLNAFHNTLDTALAEVIRVTFHGKAVYADNDFLFLGGIPLAVGFIGAG